MARKIVDCKDVSTQEKVYPRTHAQAVMMSDGRSVERAIEALEDKPSGDFLTQEVADGRYQPKGDVAYPLENHTEAVLVLTPNTMYVWGEVTALTLTLGAEESGKVNEYLFQFTSGATATTLTLPSGLQWPNGEALTPEANKTYQVSIVNGFAVSVAF